MKMKQISIATAALVGAFTLASANAAITVLTFEGVGDLNPVGNYYNGGGGGNLGIVFSPNALGLVDSDAGGSGNFGGEPSASTAMIFLDGPAATLNYAAGFTTGFSFYYSTTQPGFINVYDGLNATGNLLATLLLPATLSTGGDPTGSNSPFYPIGVAFSGTAMSVDFGGTVNQIGFDDITFGTDNPVSGIPEPGSLVGLGCVLATGLGFRSRRQRPLSA